MLRLGNDILSIVKQEEHESQYKLLTQSDERRKNNLGIRLYKKVYNDRNLDHVDFSWKGNIVTLYKYCPEYQDGIISIED